jgi:hypothetical protein
MSEGVGAGDVTSEANRKAELQTALAQLLDSEKAGTLCRNLKQAMGDNGPVNGTHVGVEAIVKLFDPAPVVSTAI